MGVSLVTRGSVLLTIHGWWEAANQIPMMAWIRRSGVQ